MPNAPAPAFTLDEIQTKVIIILSEQSNAVVTLSTELSSLGLDSMDYMHLAVMLESTFGMEMVSDADLFQLATVEQVVLYVESYLRKRSEAEASRVAASA